MQNMYADTITDDRPGLLPQTDDPVHWIIGPPKAFYPKDLGEVNETEPVLFLEFGFIRGEKATYTKNNSSITAEVFEMSDVEAAYGIYTLLKPGSGEEMAVGTESSFSGFNLMFWKGNYFIKLTASDCELPTMQGMIKFATLMDKKLDNLTSRPPSIVNLMYSDVSMPVDIKFFRGWNGFSDIYSFLKNRHFTIVDGVYANYGESDVTLFQYRNSTEVTNVFDQISNILIRDPGFKNKNYSGESLKLTDNQENKITFETFENYIIMTVEKYNNTNNVILSAIKKNILQNTKS